MHFSEKVIEEECSRLAALSHFHNLVTVILDDIENLRRQGVVSQISIIHALLIAIFSILACRCSSIVLCLNLLRNKFRLFVSKSHKA